MSKNTTIFTCPGSSDELAEIFDEGMMQLNSKVIFPVNITEIKDDYIVAAEVPGVDPKDVKISYVGNKLIISGDFNERTDLKDGRHHLRERRFGKFERQFLLPTDANLQSVTSEHQNGVLTLKIAKGTPIQPTQILPHDEKLPPIPNVSHVEEHEKLPPIPHSEEPLQTETKSDTKQDESGSQSDTQTK